MTVFNEKCAKQNEIPCVIGTCPNITQLDLYLDLRKYKEGPSMRVRMMGQLEKLTADGGGTGKVVTVQTEVYSVVGPFQLNKLQLGDSLLF